MTASGPSTTVAGPTPWESADVQLARVRQFVLADIGAAVGGLLLLVAMQLIWDPDWVWPPILAVVAGLAVLVYSLRLLAERRLSAAVFAVAASFWFVIPTIAFVLPPAFAAFSVGSIWPVLLATPYVDRVTLRRMAVVTLPVAVLSLAFSLRGDPFGVEETLGSTVMNTALVVIGVAFILLTLVMIWAYNSRLQDTLTGLQQTNARLAANERQLEDKVAARTAELESASAYLRAVIENLPQGLVTLDRDGFLLERNAAFVDQFGLHGVEIGLDELPAPLREVVAGLDDPMVLAADGDGSRFVDLSRDRVGKVTAMPITVGSAGGRETIGAVVVVDDVTAERQIDRMKTDFISTVSHELRTPLTSVLGFARIIQKRLDDRVFPNVDPEAKGAERAMRQVDENLRIILDEGGRLTDLINDVLDISKMEARQVDWNFEPLSVDTVVDPAVAATSSLFATGPVSVRVEVDDDLPPVRGDRQRLVQVLINLLSNAQKFTDDGTVTVRARRADHGGSEAVALSVTDTGIGVAEADLPLLFERFRQVGDSLTDRPTGTGLGLPICKEIVEAHDGTIEAHSTLGVGTTFEVLLPAADVPVPAEAATSPPVEPTVVVPEIVATRRPTAADPDAPHVLVVDDDDGIRSLLRELFENEGYRITEASTGAAAVRLATAERPDLVTLDVLMPGMSGVDTALALRTSAATATVPLMFVSVLDRIDGPALGVDAHVTKPIDADHLLASAAELIARRRDHDEGVVVVNASTEVLRSVVEGLTRFGYEPVGGSHEELAGPDTADPADAGDEGVRLVIANGAVESGRPVLDRWRFRRGSDELIVIVFDDDGGGARETP